MNLRESVVQAKIAKMLRVEFQAIVIKLNPLAVAGLPDLLVLKGVTIATIMHSRLQQTLMTAVWFIEVKRDARGKPTPSQSWWHDKLRAIGAQVSVEYDVEMVREKAMRVFGDGGEFIPVKKRKKR